MGWTQQLTGDHAPKLVNIGDEDVSKVYNTHFFGDVVIPVRVREILVCNFDKDDDK